MNTNPAPGVFTRTNTPSRIQRQSGPTSRPPCFAQLWWDCTDGSVYLVFSDSSVYRYPEFMTEIKAIMIAPTIGTTFNDVFRLGADPGSPNPFGKVTGGIPVTATQIYQFPPYRNPLPSPCFINPLPDLLWTTDLLPDPGAGDNGTPPDGSTGASFMFNFNPGLATVNCEFVRRGTVVYSGVSFSGTLDLTGTCTGMGLSNLNVQASLTFNGGFQGGAVWHPGDTFPTSVPFTVPDSTSSPTTIEIFLYGHSGFAPFILTGLITGTIHL